MTRVIYDMDKTITRKPTYTRWLVYWAAREAPWRLALLPLAGVAAVGFRIGLMRRDRAEGHDIIVATASFAFYARAIVARLGITAVVATGSVWDGDRLRARIDGDNCYGVAKAAMVAAAFPGERFFRAYSDHVSDAALFAMAAEPVAVTPSRGLRRLARAQGWRIADWRLRQRTSFTWRPRMR
jgi:phosphatidylglycerophosphatase C